MVARHMRLEQMRYAARLLTSLYGCFRQRVTNTVSDKPKHQYWESNAARSSDDGNQTNISYIYPETAKIVNLQLGSFDAYCWEQLVSLGKPTMVPKRNYVVGPNGRGKIAEISYTPELSDQFALELTAGT